MFSHWILELKKPIALIFPDKKIPIDYFKSVSSLENYRLNVKFCKNSNYKLKYLTDDELIVFLEKFENLNLFKDIKPNESKSYCNEKFQHIDKMTQCSVKIYYENDDVKEFKIINHFPEKWIDFGNLLHDLVGFDVLNIENLKYLICNLHFDIKKRVST